MATVAAGGFRCAVVFFDAVVLVFDLPHQGSIGRWKIEDDLLDSFILHILHIQIPKRCSLQERFMLEFFARASASHDEPPGGQSSRVDESCADGRGQPTRCTERKH